MVTDKADTNKKGPATADTAADHPTEKAVHNSGEANVPTAQQDTTHTASMDHQTGVLLCCHVVND